MPGGRPKGAINRRSLEAREQFDAACKKHNFNLIEWLVEIAADPSVEMDHRTRAAQLVTPYVYPKLKAQELTVTDPVRLVVIDASKEEVDPLS